MDFYYTYLEGRITIPEKPKYYQRGDGLILRENGRYLVVQVGKIEGLTPPDNVGIVNSFVTVHWGNQKSSTRTVFDNFSPTFNEEMYFKISLEKEPKDPKFYEEVKSYLKSRAEITLYVWLDLQNGSYENIGYMKVNLSELQGQLPEEKGFYDFENKKQVKFMCRTASVRKRVVSSLIDSTNTYLVLNFYLMPDYDAKKLDVSDLTKVEGDKLDPLVYKSIKELESSEPYLSHKEFLRWTFKDELEIFRDSNFKFIFAVDQCNIKRFLPTYLEPFSVDYTPPQSEEYSLSQVLTAKDIFSYVNNIPFIEDYKKPELIASPDFVLAQNKGTVTDHVIVLACIMMGCNYETQEEVGKMKELAETYKKEMVSFENRVFVCVGTNKFSKKRELWLMTYNRNLTSVTMWDVKDGMSYELKGRVSTGNPDVVKTLRAYLKFDPTKEVTKDEQPLEALLKKINQKENPEEEKKLEIDSDDNSEVNFDIDKMVKMVYERCKQRKMGL